MADPKASVIEVELPRTPRAKKSAVQRRLENSPARSPRTPEQLQERLQKAARKRSAELEARLKHAVAHNEQVQEVLQAQQQKRAGIIEVQVKASPSSPLRRRAKKGAVQKRLEHSPLRSPLPTKERLQSKLAAAEQRRQTIEKQRQEAARAELARVQKVHDAQQARQQAVIVVDVKKCTPKRKPAVQRRLEFSPMQSPILTKADLEQKQKSASVRKLNFDAQRQATAKAHVAMVKSRAEAARQRGTATTSHKDKENVEAVAQAE